MNKIAIFASGNGTNAENLIRYFKSNRKINVELIASNNGQAKVLRRAKNHGISTIIFNKKELKTNTVINYLKKKKISFIILAGFLLKIPQRILNNYPEKILNIHPSLLPLYGGDGMYGMYVHEQVFKSKDNYSGITIHFVNEVYDGGNIVFQAKCPISSTDSPKAIQTKVHNLEIKFFPIIVEKVINGIH